MHQLPARPPVKIARLGNIRMLEDFPRAPSVSQESIQEPLAQLQPMRVLIVKLANILRVPVLFAVCFAERGHTLSTVVHQHASNVVPESILAGRERHQTQRVHLASQANTWGCQAVTRRETACCARRASTRASTDYPCASAAHQGSI